MDLPRRQFVPVVQRFAFGLPLRRGDRPSLFPPVVRPVFFPGEFPLFAPVAVVLVGEVEHIHRRIVAGVDSLTYELRIWPIMPAI